MQLELIFVAPSSEDGTPSVWEALDEEQKNDALDVLARLIAKAATAAAAVAEVNAATFKERDNE